METGKKELPYVFSRNDLHFWDQNKNIKYNTQQDSFNSGKECIISNSVLILTLLGGNFFYKVNYTLVVVCVTSDVYKIS